MSKEVFNGIDIAYQMEESNDIIDYTTTRFWVNGKEISPFDIKLIFSSDEEEDTLRDEWIYFMKKNRCFSEFKAEIHNIGNENLETIEISEGVFDDENYLQWDVPVTDIDWKDIATRWRNHYDD